MECGVGKEKRQGLWTFGMFATRPKTPGTITDDYLYETGFNVALYESQVPISGTPALRTRSFFFDERAPGTVSVALSVAYPEVPKRLGDLI